MTEGEGAAPLALGPRWLYPLKAGATHLRSYLWLGRTGGRPRPAAGVRILFYHRVSDDPDVLAVRPRRFADQMAAVAALGLRCVDVVELGRRLAAREPTDSLVGLSFDDGYLDVAEQAAPVLERHGFAATVFVATAVTSGEASFTWYERQPPLMPWPLIRELDGQGALRFEAHTRTHPNLLQLQEAQVRDEIARGKAELEERLDRTVDTFCYPAGLFGERERALVAAAGFRTAVSCEPGLNTPDTDPLALRRTQIDRSDTLVDFRAKLLGGHDTPPPLRATWRRVRYGAGS